MAENNGKRNRAPVTAPIWEDVPENAKRPGGKLWVVTLEQIKNRPGKSARVREYDRLETAKKAVYDLRAGRVPKPSGRFEFYAGLIDETDPESRAAVWAEYLGEEEAVNP